MAFVNKFQSYQSELCEIWPFIHISCPAFWDNFVQIRVAMWWSFQPKINHKLYIKFWLKTMFFSNFSCMFLNPNNFFQLEFSNCSNLFEVRNLQVQVKSFCYQKLIWPFTVWINCSSDREKLLKFVAEGRESVNVLRSLE